MTIAIICAAVTAVAAVFGGSLGRAAARRADRRKYGKAGR